MTNFMQDHHSVIKIFSMIYNKNRNENPIIETIMWLLFTKHQNNNQIIMLKLNMITIDPLL